MILSFPGSLWRLHRLLAAWEEASSPASGPGVLLPSSQGHACRLTLFTRPALLAHPHPRLCRELLYAPPDSLHTPSLAGSPPRHAENSSVLLKRAAQPGPCLCWLHCVYLSIYLKYFTGGPFSNLSLKVVAMEQNPWLSCFTACFCV